MTAAALLGTMTVGAVSASASQPPGGPGDRVPAVAVEKSHAELRTGPAGVNPPEGQGDEGKDQAPPRRANEPDPVAQLSDAPSSDTGDVHQGIDNLGAPDTTLAGITAGASPPDTTGDVGPDHFVQMVNATQFQIWDKQGNDLTGGPLNFGALWPAGDPCNANLGDPIVVYDHLADRWLLTQFARNAAQTQFWMCLAISQTPDPTAGSWFLYTQETPAFPDYPKFGVWPDGYYMSSYEGSDLGIYVFDRVNMLQGNAAGFVSTTISSLSPQAGVRNTRILPAEIDGQAPPNGTPVPFVRTVDDVQDTANPTDRVEIWEATVDWTSNTLNFSLEETLTSGDGLAPFTIMTCDRNGGGTRDCIPQPDTEDTLDALSNRPMMQLKYRSFGSERAMVFNQTVDVSGSLPNSLPGATDEVAGVRWYELREDGGNYSIEDQGTYAPQPNDADDETEFLHRWMGSAAMDRFGNIALGYSVTNSDSDAGEQVYPGIRYAGRLADDTPGVMAQGEQVITSGTTSQGNTDGTVQPQRWGDYGQLSVDPVDDCTFWYTTHTAGGATQIASFRFDDCAADLSVSKTAVPSTAIAGEQLTYTVTVDNAGPLDASDVTVTDTLPAGTTFVTATATCTAAGGVVTCDVGQVNNGQSVSFDIVVDVDPDVLVATAGPTTITNTVSVSAAQFDPDTSNNEATLNTVVNEQADLQVTKTCKPDDSAPAGTSGHCDILVINHGPSTARNVVLEDHLSSSGAYTIESATTNPAGGSCVIGTDHVVCDLGNIDPQDAVTVTVTVSSADQVDVNDVARVGSDTPDPDISNNEDRGSVRFTGSADLELDKSGPPTVVAGETMTYLLAVTNHGPSTATGVTASDVVPAGVEILDVTSSSGSCTAGIPGDAAAPSQCKLGNLASGDSATMSILVRVLPDTTGTLANNGRVSSEIDDPNTGNNLDTVSTTVTAEADLTTVKTASPDPVIAGETLTFELLIGNDGPSTARNLSVSDALPPEVTYVGASIDTGVGVCELHPANNVECTGLGDLDPGDTITIVIQTVVDPSTPHVTISNSATVTSPTLDPAPGNNTDTAEVAVTTEADLSLAKDSNFETGNSSTTIIYQIVTTNFGPSDAQDVQVVDELPSVKKGNNEKVSVVFVTEGCVYDPGPHVVTCQHGTMVPGASATVEIHVQVSGNTGVLTNTATASSTTTDPDGSNNTDVEDVTVSGGSDKPGGPGGGRGKPT